MRNFRTGRCPIACFVVGLLLVSACNSTAREESIRIAAADQAELQKHVGQRLTVSGTVSRTNESSGSGHQFVNFADSELTIICFARDRVKVEQDGFAFAELPNRQIEISGTLETYRNRLQIRLHDPQQIRLVDPKDNQTGGANDSAHSPDKTVDAGRNKVAGKPTKPAPAVDGPAAAGTEEPVLVQVEKDVWRSPAGLRYQGQDIHGLTRREHVLRHARDLPDREGSHGVFDVQGEAIFSLIDEAWQRAQQKKLRPQREGDRSALTVPMGRRVGYLGGQAGARRGHPELRRILIIFEADTRNVVTAYPK